MLIYTCLAKALYDNVAETPEELEFRRGEVLTVVQRDYNGIDGWWLCSLRGRQGLVPGNRLKMISGMYDAGSEGHRNSLDSATRNINNEVLTPQKVGNVFVYDKQPTPVIGGGDYDVPPRRNSPMHHQTPNRQTQPMDSQGNYDVPPTSQRKSVESNPDTNQMYDVLPSQKHRNSEGYDSNRSSVMSTGSGASMSTSASNTSFKGQGHAGSDRSSFGFEVVPQEVYDIPRPARKICAEENTTILQQQSPSQKQQITDLYDVPPALRLKDDLDSGVYDSLPASKTHIGVDRNVTTKVSVQSDECPKTSVIKIDDHDYDLPVDGATGSSRSARSGDPDTYDTLPNKSLVGGRAQKGEMGSVYDIPPQVTKDVPLRDNAQCLLEGLEEQIRRMSTSSYDSSRSSDLPNIPYDELPIELDAAMDLLVKVQQDLTTATTRLLGFINSSWRKRANLEPVIYDVRQACVHFLSCLTEFVSFGQGALANSTRAADKNLVRKLYKSLQPILECHQTVSKAVKNQENVNWSVPELVQDVIDLKSEDDLTLIMTCARNVSIDLRTLVSVIQGNSSLLFKRVLKNDEFISDGVRLRCNSPNRSGIQDRPLPTPPSKMRALNASLNTSIGAVEPDVPLSSSTPIKSVRSKENALDDDNDYENDSREWLADDYVQLEWKEKMERKLLEKRQREAQERANSQTENISIDFDKSGIKDALTPQQKVQFEKVEEESLKPVDTNVPITEEPAQCKNSPVSESGLTTKDKQLLEFYSNQMVTHAGLLTNAIEAFLNCIEYNHPPKIFVAHSKFVLLNAHKIVYIGDTLTRSLNHLEIKNKVMLCANHLCECLKQTVLATKHATFSYPSVTAVQEMVDRIVDVSHSVNEMKQIITKGASL
ncbi:breast cancer anti-estrogen resistance protein 1-like isoform X2 [Tubulanus polymorphus]|uniref:breast cancer anti-estrogen resistance protein 1-like isoform X2 n=1 Tax=Tubulanus polymorphus TaxID=672921 RepID=UPI003DA68E92